MAGEREIRPMAIDKTGEYWKGTEFADLIEYIGEHTKEGYPAQIVQQCICRCGGTIFQLEVDADEGCGRRICSSCGKRAFIGDSKELWSEANSEPCVCPCGSDRFEIGIGFSLRPDKEIEWITLGVRCVQCDLLGSPADWEIDYGPTKHLFEKTPRHQVSLARPLPAVMHDVTSADARTFIDNIRGWTPVWSPQLYFYATDAEVQDWLVNHLPTKYAPYRIVAEDILSESRKETWPQPACCHPSDFLQFMTGPNGNRFNFWIWSQALTPNLDLERSYSIMRENFGLLCSLNGLPALQHGLNHRGFRERSGVCMALKARNLEEHRTVEHPEYEEILKTLQKQMRKCLRYSTIRGGHEDTKWRMTEGAVRAHSEGFPFDAKPGSLIEKKKRS